MERPKNGAALGCDQGDALKRTDHAGYIELQAAQASSCRYASIRIEPITERSALEGAQWGVEGCRIFEEFLRTRNFRHLRAFYIHSAGMLMRCIGAVTASEASGSIKTEARAV